MKGVLNALSLVLNNGQISALDEESVCEAKHQAVYSLICTASEAIPYIANNVSLMWEQQKLSEILEGIPYLVIKGSCSAIYYPEPIRRTMGDIDILVKPAFFRDAYYALWKAGYWTSETYDLDTRHIHFEHNGILMKQI